MIEILILLTVWLIACALCAVVGFFVGYKYKDIIKPKKTIEPLTEAQEMKKAKARHEEENFWNYSGVVQEDFITKV